MNLRCVLVLIHVIAFSIPIMATDLFTPVASNVPYEDVEALSSNKPAKILAYGDGEFQFGELWLPAPTNAGPQPLVVLIHGGCWLNSFDLTHLHPVATALTELGYAVWSLEYRRIGDPGGGWPGTYDDIVAGINFIPTLKSEDIDSSRIVLVGHSAGGHLVSLVTADLSQRIHHSAAIKKVIGMAAIFDIETYSEGESNCQQAVKDFITGTDEERRHAFQRANPARRDIKANRLVLVHGDQDEIVPISQAMDSGQAVITVPGAGHFDMIHPGTEAWQLIVAEIDRAL